MTWAERLKRAFRIEIEICQYGGEPVLQIFRAISTGRCNTCVKSFCRCLEV